MTRFYNANFCFKCSAELTHHEKMYSDGRCPKCGHKQFRNSTIVATYDRGYYFKKVPSGKWYIPDKYERVYV